MRTMVYFTLGFAAGCAGLLYVDSRMLQLLGIAVLLVSVLLRKEGFVLGCVTLTLAGCILGCLWFSGYTAWKLEPLRPLDGEVVSCSIRATDFSRETAYGVAFYGTMEQAGKHYSVIVYLDHAEPFQPGDCISGDFRLRLTTDAGENPSDYYSGKGIFLLAYQTDTLVRWQTPQTWKDTPALIRERMKAVLQACVPADCVPFAKALLLGDTSELSYETDTNLKLSGIRHVVAVSGLHISILFALISAVTFRKRFLTALVGIPLLCLFAAIAGFTPSVNRACIMSGLMLIAQVFHKSYDGPTALSSAVLVMLLGNPYVMGSVSFQLSVASVMGIFLYSPGIRGYFARCLGEKKGRTRAILGRLSSATAVTLGAQGLTIPLCAYYFGVVSLVGVVTNLLVLWVISLTFCLLAVISLIGMVSQSAAGLMGLAAAALIRYVLAVAKWMAALPFAAVYTVSPYVVAWLVFVYLLLCLFFACGKRLPGTFLCCGILGLCLALTASWCEPLASDVSFTVLDVGQGQCLLLQSGGRTYVIDCGGDSDSRTADIAAEALLNRGNSHVDALILTHTDRDHAGAAENFLSRIPTDVLILPDSPTVFSIPEETRTVYAKNDLLISDGNTEISIFAPVYRGVDNEMSLCILLETKKCDILITGDRNGFAERSLLRHARIPDVDILIAGHHGARDATCEELLQAVQPEIVCISVGAENPYGHPAPELLKRLEEFGCTVYRTDRDGTITIRR